MIQLFDAQLIILLCIPSFLIGLSRGGLGGGFGLAAAIFTAQLMEPISAAAFLLPILVASDPLSIFIYRNYIYWKSLIVLIPGAIIGIITTYFLINIISNSVIGLIVGFLAISLVFESLISKYIKYKRIKYNPIIGFILGSLGGFSSFIIHSGLPPIAAYLLPFKLSRQSFMGTVAIIFGIINIIKILPYLMLDLFDEKLINTALFLIPVSYLGIFIGKIINNKISDKVFYYIIYTTIFLLGLRLILISF